MKPPEEQSKSGQAPSAVKPEAQQRSRARVHAFVAHVAASSPRMLAGSVLNDLQHLAKVCASVDPAKVVAGLREADRDQFVEHLEAIAQWVETVARAIEAKRAKRKS
jgi:hypothetical protein